jgi:hypothetical protein
MGLYFHFESTQPGKKNPAHLHVQDFKSRISLVNYFTD